MTSTREALAVATLIMVAALVASERYEPNGVYITKPLASLGFLGVGLASGATSSAYGRVILAGLVLGAIGDVLLIPRSNKAFLGGLVSFLLGHVAYVIAFVGRGPSLGLTAAGGAAALVAAVVIGRWLLPHVVRAMKVPVLAYMTVICAMVAVAVGASARPGGLVVLLGAVMFFVSDLAVARHKFVAPGFVNKAWGLPLYYGAQLVLAWNV